MVYFQPSTSSSWNVFDRSPYFDLRDQRSDNPTLSPYNTQPDIINLGDLFDFGQRPSYNAVASDHTYPRNPEDAHHLPPISEAGTPMVATIHLTIMHIQRQARLLRQQVSTLCFRLFSAVMEVFVLDPLTFKDLQVIGDIEKAARVVREINKPLDMKGTL